MAADSLRLLAAAASVLAWLAMCAAIARRQFGKRRSVREQNGPGGTAPAWIVAFASQTGTAEELAAQTAATLRLAGVSVRLCGLSDLTLADLAQAERALFVASTYGEGDPPDNAALFAGRASDATSLAGLHYAVLALGDSSYTHFCGFGKSLDHWLQQRGAQALFDRLDVDRGHAAAIDAWRQHLSHLVGTSDLPDWSGPEFGDWILAERRLLNPDSAGAPVFHLELESAEAALPEWQSGDLVQVLVPGAAGYPREYSIASIPDDGRVHLAIRLHRRADGSNGAASGWLATQAAIGSRIKMRLRPHRRFRLEDNFARPLILIGNGTGIAGLRSHLKARAHSAAAPNWLLFGERSAACDFHYRAEIDAWRASGVLRRTDLVFSRDRQKHRYVQDCLLDAGEMLQEWIWQGAAIYVCGSLKGMAEGVDSALATLLGRARLEQLAAEGRYRRDLY